MKCQTCTPVFTPTPDLPHHGKETCAVCSKFLRWVPKPETEVRQRRNAANVVRLRGDERLTEWERGFIGTLDGHGPKMSPKQQAILDKLATKYR